MPNKTARAADPPDISAARRSKGLAALGVAGTASTPSAPSGPDGRSEVRFLRSEYVRDFRAMLTRSAYSSWSRRPSAKAALRTSTARSRSASEAREAKVLAGSSSSGPTAATPLSFLDYCHYTHIGTIGDTSRLPTGGGKTETAASYPRVLLAWAAFARWVASLGFSTYSSA